MKLPLAALLLTLASSMSDPIRSRSIMRRASKEDARSKLEAQINADHHDHKVIAQSLLDMAENENTGDNTIRDATDHSTMASAELESKATSVLHKIRSRVDKERSALWQSLKEKLGKVENCVTNKEVGASLAEVVESEDGQAQLSLMAELDRLASEHRSCRMEQDEARVTVQQCESQVHVHRRADHICTPLRTAQEDQKQACNAAQSFLETKACLVEQRSKICEERTECHTEAMKVYKAAKDKAEAQEQHLRTEEHTLLQVECILSAGPGVSTSHCKDMKRHSSAFHGNLESSGSILLELSKPPTVQECMRGHEAKNLLASFFFALPQGAPASACTSACCHDGSATVLMELLADRKSVV